MSERQHFGGIDWGTYSHAACMVDQEGKCLGNREFPHEGEGIARMADWMIEVSGAEPGRIAVGIEVPHGPVVEGLLERGFEVFAINPRQLDRCRDRWSPAGAKDDRRDALVLADSLRTDRRFFRQALASAPEVIALREWMRTHQELTDQITQVRHRFRNLLWRYFPQFLSLADSDLDRLWTLELWNLIPNPRKAKRTRQESIRKILARHRIRRISAAETQNILRAKPIQLVEGTASAVETHAELVVQQLTALLKQLAQADRMLEECTRNLGAMLEAGEDSEEPLGRRDVNILASIPGVGKIVLATLLSEAFQPLQDRDYHALRCLCGVAPVTRQSGKSTIVRRRRAASSRLQNAMHCWGGAAMQRDPVSKAQYRAAREKGHGHARSLRGIGDRMLNVACAMLREQTAYDPSLRRTPQGQAA